MKAIRRAALAYLQAGIFTLWLCVTMPSREPLENFGAVEAIVAVSCWPLIWLMAINDDPIEEGTK